MANEGRRKSEGNKAMLYICQCPHLAPAKIWTADSEDEIIALIVGDTDNEFDSALDAARYDMRDAYITDDVFDLWLWVNGDRNAVATGAPGRFLANRSIRFEIEAMATEDPNSDDVIYTAFDGQMRFDENEGEFTLGNQPPVEAHDLVDAMLAAALTIAKRDGMVERDV